MINKENCKIIQDLLPNYIENLTSDETNSYIKNHLENCNECKTVYENMKNNLTATVNVKNNEIDFLKKIRRKIYLLILILLFIFLFILGSYIRKFIILSNITNKVNILESTNNYYAKVTSVENDNLHIIESYVTNTSTLTNFKVIAENTLLNTSMYKNVDDNIFLFISHDTKSVKTNISENDIFKVALINYSNDFNDLSLFDRLFYTIKVKNISTSKCNGSSCYLIDFYDGLQLWIEKDTGLTLRAIVSADEMDTRTYEYQYKMDISNEIIQPDINGYTIENN